MDIHGHFPLKPVPGSTGSFGSKKKTEDEKLLHNLLQLHQMSSSDKSLSAEAKMEPEANTKANESKVGLRDLSELSLNELRAYVQFLGILPPSPKTAGFLAKVKIELERAENQAAQERETDMRRKDGEIWTCVDRVDNPGGGYIYAYRMKPGLDDQVTGEYSKDDLVSALDAIYPAVEPQASVVLDQFQFSEQAEAMRVPKETIALLGGSGALSLREAFETYGGRLLAVLKDDALTEAVMPLVYNRLGFEAYIDAGGYTVLKLPDRAVLEERWEKLREEYPELPSIKIVDSEGISPHLDFVRSSMTHDSLLSVEGEFVHDHMTHLSRLIKAIVKLGGGKAYGQAKFQYAQLVVDRYKRLMAMEYNVENIRDRTNFSDEEMKLLKASLGATIDVFAAQEDFDHAKFRPEDFAQSVSTRFTDDKDFKSWAEKTLDSEASEKLPRLWERLELETTSIFGGHPTLNVSNANVLLWDEPIGSTLVAQDAVYVKYHEVANWSGNRVERVEYEFKGDKAPYTLTINIGDEVRVVGGLKRKVVPVEVIDDLSRRWTQVGTALTRLVDSIPEAAMESPRRSLHDLPDESLTTPGSYVIWGSNIAFAPVSTLSVAVREGNTTQCINYLIWPFSKGSTVGFSCKLVRGGDEILEAEAATFDEFMGKLNEHLGGALKERFYLPPAQ